MSQTADCLSYNYTHEPTFQKSVVTHVCTLTGLVPATLYQYSVGSVSDGFSDVMNFTSAPLSGSEGARMVLFVVSAGLAWADWCSYGDLGAINGEATAALLTEVVHKKEVDMVIHCGDIGLVAGVVVDVHVVQPMLMISLIRTTEHSTSRFLMTSTTWCRRTRRMCRT